MGGENSKKKSLMLDIVENYGEDLINERYFVTEMLKSIEQVQNHSPAGPILIIDMHLLKLFYEMLVQRQNISVLPKTRLVDVIKKIYKTPEKSMEYSFRLIQPDEDRTITKKQFIDFVINCFAVGTQRIFKKSNFDVHFKEGFYQWTHSQKHLLENQLANIFKAHAQTHKDQWAMSDFKRWILNQQHWTLHVEINDQAFKIPLNLTCLFGVRIQKDD